MNKIKRLKQVTEVVILAISSDRSDPAAQYKLYDKLISMGGLYIKFVQLLLVKLGEEHKKMAVEFSFLLKKTYDSSPYERINIEALLRRELDNNLKDIKSIEREPFAAGSFGQVYKATLKNGETVAIKALRPSVLRNIRFDIKMLGFVARIVSMTHRGGSFDVFDIFRKFKSTTLNELDYPREVFYAEELYKRYADHPSLIIPKTYPKLCSKHLITQEYIDGIMLTDVLAQKELGFDAETYTEIVTGSDLNHQMIAIGQSMLESMFIEGTAHGDPHPGNIKLLPNNKVALLDFGIYATAPSDKQAFFKLVKQYQKIYAGKFDLEGYTWAMVDLFVRDLSIAARSLDRYGENRISQQLFRAITESASGIFQSSIDDIDHLLHSNRFLRVFGSVINEDNRFGFNMEIEQPEFMRATLMYIELIGSLGIKNRVLNEVYTNAVNNLEKVDMSSKKTYVSPEDAVSIIAEWLEKVASKDIYLYRKLSQRISTRSINI